MGLRVILAFFSLIAAVLHVNGAAPYSVNNRRSANGCSSDSYLSFETGTLDVMRGTRGAPCAGYLKFAAPQPGGLSSNRICTAGILFFFKEAAKRACWTLGNNLHRDPNTGEETMLYSCDTYMEANVEFPDVNTGTLPVSAVGGGISLGPLQGKRCLTPLQADTDCFGECYGPTDPGAFVPDGFEQDCIGIVPYWATTCSDIDECQNGVHGKCEGPFEEHCTLRPPCGHNTKCTNMPGTWECECLDGFKYAVSSDLYDPSIGCIDIDECEDPDICGINGQCRNTNGSYFCICTSRQLWDKSTGKCTVGQCSSPPTLPNAYTASTSGTYDYEDKITYHCVTGHHVSAKELSGVVPTFYGYSQLNTFELTCNAYGEWGPQPIPACVPVYCGDPWVVPNAVRSGSDFRFGSEVQFDCNKGFGVKDGYDYDDSFKMTCQVDGTWSDIQRCEDINECDHGSNPCGYDSKRCINTVGSYLCVCAPGYYHDDNNYDSCVPLEPEEFPSPCTTMKNLQLCDHGTCKMYDDKATCSCDPGYEGKLCDRPITSIALIIAAVALALTGFFILLLIVCCLLRICRPGFVGPPGHVGPVGPVAPPPIYGGIEPAYAKRPVPLSSLGGRRFPF